MSEPLPPSKPEEKKSPPVSLPNQSMNTPFLQPQVFSPLPVRDTPSVIFPFRSVMPHTSRGLVAEVPLPLVPPPTQFGNLLTSGERNNRSLKREYITGKKTLEVTTESKKQRKADSLPSHLSMNS